MNFNPNDKFPIRYINHFTFRIALKGREVVRSFANEKTTLTILVLMNRSKRFPFVSM